MTNEPRTESHRRGFALICGVWGVARLALIAAAVASSGIAARRGRGITVQRAQADAVAEAGINDAIVSLLAPRAGQMRRIDGIAYVTRFAGTDISVSIQDEYGKIDLN